MEHRFFDKDYEVYPYSSHHSDEIDLIFGKRDPVVTDRLRRLAKDIKLGFLCFTNRVGSNRYTDILDRAGVGIRVAEEDFNSASVKAAQEIYDLKSFEEYLTYLIKATARNGTMVVKIGPQQLHWLATRGYLGDIFPHATYLFIQRQDKIAQAISLYIANNTGSYTAGETDVADSAVPFSVHGIAQQLMWIMTAERDFRYFFELHGITPCEVFYEAVQKDAIGTLKDSLACLGVEIDEATAQAAVTRPERVVRQSSGTKDDFARRFRKHFRF